MKNLWDRYAVTDFYDELTTPKGSPRRAARKLVSRLRKFSLAEIRARQAAAELSIREMGISFTVCGSFS